MIHTNFGALDIDVLSENVSTAKFSQVHGACTVKVNTRFHATNIPWNMSCKLAELKRTPQVYTPETMLRATLHTKDMHCCSAHLLNSQ